MGACGFTPLYATPDQSDSVVSELAAISVQAPNDRVNRVLRIALEDKLRATSLAAPQYRVLLETRLSEANVAVQQDREVTRKNLRLRTSFALHDIETDELLFEAKSFGIVTFNRVASEFANIIAERDAEERVANQVAEDIHSKLAVYFERQTAR